MPPQPGDLGVAPLVRRDGHAPEWEAYDYREAGREQAERWGPPREGLDAKTTALALVGLAVTLAFAIMLSGVGLTPDRYLLVMLVPALLLRRARRYLVDFVPFIVLLVLYGQFRGIAHLLHPIPHYFPQLRADEFLFGVVPAAELQHWFWTGSVQWYDQLILDVTKLHFIVPPILAFLFWMKRRALFYRFTATLLTLSFAAALTFFLFPAAPPWAAGEQGLLPGLIRIPHNPAAGPSYHGMGGISLSRLVEPNPYAAIPSLHAGYAFLCFLFVATLAWKTRWRWWALGLGLLYPVAQSFAAVYTGNHYVVDLFIGYVFAGVAFFAVRRFWRWRGWPQ